MLGSKGLYFIEDLGSSAYRSMYRDSALAGQEAPGILGSIGSTRKLWVARVVQSPT